MAPFSSLLRRSFRTSLGLAVLWGAPCEATSGDEVYLELGSDFQSIVNAHPAGTHYVVRSGVHRGVRIIPKDEDIISGEAGAVLNGCLELADWRREGEWWVHDVPVLVPESLSAGVFCADRICTQPQDLYIDDERLYAVRTQAEVWGDDHWFLDRAAGRVYLRRDPTGREVELGGPSPVAIDCSPSGLPARRGVIIEDLRIEKYPTPPQIGAVRLGGNAVCRRCEIRQSHAHGVQLMGSATVQDCYLHDNGMCGIGGIGIGAIIERCEISDNVWSYYAGVAWDNGGMKIAGSAGSTIRRCYVHHNHGPGIWTDIRSHDILVEDNIIEFNDWEGTLFELSDHIIIRRNICRWNGVHYRGEEEGALWGGQICIQNSNFVEVESNYLECGPGHHSPWGSGQGVVAINQNDRARDEGLFGGDFGVHTITVHHNVTVIPFYGHSGVDYGTLGWNTYEDFLNAGLSWHDNRYLAGQPLDLSWSWRLAERWDDTVAKWCKWEGWKSHQDAGSTVETFGPDQYQPTGTRQWEVIREATGHDYPAFKAGLTRRPPPSAKDGDGDGVPDVWERKYFGRVEVSGGGDDPDGDGWDNAREFIEHTLPALRDTDADGLPDPWEFSHGLDPNVFDSETDADLDGRSAREEYEDGTDPAVAQPLDQPVPEASLSLWLETVSGLVTRADGTLESWTEHGPHRLAVEWTGTPAVTGASPAGRPLVDPGAFLACPGDPAFWGTATSGFTMAFVYQPTAIDLSAQHYSILTNEAYLETGFRLRLEAGYLVLSSGQSGGSLYLAGHTRLEADRPYVISINYSAPGGRHALYLDGRVEAWQSAGLILPSANFLILGSTWGTTPQPGRFGDVAVFDRALSHRERRTVESLLRQKFQTGFPPSADRDLDGLPDVYELAHQLDAATPDGLGDEDRDGAVNLSEFEHASDPQILDTDHDGMPDGWEIEHALNPLVRDGNGDPDVDGVTNLSEFEEGTDPQHIAAIPPALDFVRLRLWWRSDVGLTVTGQQATRWADSSPGGQDGMPAEGAAGPSVSADPWLGRASVVGSTAGSLASGDVDLRTFIHQPGVTLMAALRSPVALGAPGVFQPLLSAGGASLGAIDGKLAARSMVNGTLLTASAARPSGPAIVTLTLPLAPGRARLYADGEVLAEGDGIVPVLTAPVQLGGMADPWPAEVAEIVVFAGVLPHRHRVLWERMLEGKWQGGGPLAGDTDGDGLPDWWEWEAATDPGVSDAVADADFDEVSNLSAFQQGRGGFVWKDEDHDGMHDGWETDHGLDPQSDDAELDLDGDGLSNAVEHALGTRPNSGGNPPEAWAVVSVGDSTAPQVAIKFWNNRRSWRARAVLEESDVLADGGWQLLAMPEPAAPPEAGISRFAVGLRPGASAPPASHFRLRLLGE